MDRITNKHLEGLVKRLNQKAGYPTEPYAKDDQGSYKPVAHVYHLSYAYGGVCLHQMCSSGSGVSDVFRCGHISRRDLYHRIYSFLDGIDACQKGFENV